jgi:hypothetical protein
VDGIAAEAAADGRDNLRLHVGGQIVSWCEVIPLTLRYGAGSTASATSGPSRSTDGRATPDGC